jgi:hypothetical protein
MDLSPLQAFVPAGTRPFTGDHITIGGSGHAVFNRFVIGGSGYGLVGDRITTDSAAYTPGGGLGMFETGYLIVSTRNLKIFPLLGVGGFGYALDIVKTRKVSASQISDNPGREVSVSTGGLCADIAVQMNFIPAPSYSEKNKGYGGFMTALRIGYTGSIPSAAWNYTGGEVTSGPRFNLGMVYAKLIFGGFGFRE